MTLSIFYTALYFFSFCNKLFLNNKWGVSCFVDSALNRFVEVSGARAWTDADAVGLWQYSWSACQAVFLCSYSGWPLRPLCRYPLKMSFSPSLVKENFHKAHTVAQQVRHRLGHLYPMQKC